MASAVKPNKPGIKAPPTIAVQSKPEPFGLKSPKPSMAKVKMVGNIMELNKPIANTVHIENSPPVFIVNKSNTMAPMLNIASTLPGAIILVKTEPVSYTHLTLPTICSV